MKVLYIYTMYIHFTYLPPTSSSLVSLNSPPSSFKSFLFFLHLLSITAWSNQRTCGCSLGHEQPTSAHITEREWVSLLQQPSTSASGSSVGTLWDPPIHAGIWTGLIACWLVQVTGMLRVDACNSHVMSRSQCSPAVSPPTSSYLLSTLPSVKIPEPWVVEVDKMIHS